MSAATVSSAAATASGQPHAGVPPELAAKIARLDEFLAEIAARHPAQDGHVQEIGRAHV